MTSIQTNDVVTQKLPNRFKLIPIFNSLSKDKFVSTNLLTPKTVSYDGVTLTTSALVAGVPLDIMGISISDVLLEKGLQCNTDSIYPDIFIDAIYLQVTNPDKNIKEVFQIRIGSLTNSRYHFSAPNDFRTMTGSGNLAIVSPNSKSPTGKNTQSVLLSEIDPEETSVILEIYHAGLVNLETASAEVHFTKVKCVAVFHKKEQLNISDEVAQKIICLFDDASVVGYDLCIDICNHLPLNT